MKSIIDKETLENLYSQGLSIIKIANQLNVGKKVVAKNLNYHGIKKRTKQENNQLISNSLKSRKMQQPIVKHHSINFREDLISLYTPNKIENNLLYYDDLIICIGDVYNDKVYYRNLIENSEKRIIILFEYEWLKHRNAVIHYLNNVFSKNRKLIYARKCEIKEISSKEAHDFENEYHIQGFKSAPIRYGLFYEDTMVSLMTFGKPNYNRNYQYELVRYCTSERVVGGSEKIFAAFNDKYNPTSIISYCDIAKFSGDVYSKLGFSLKGITSPNYFWVKDNEIYSRIACQKFKLSKLFDDTIGQQSEIEYMTSKGFLRLFNAGSKIYVLN